MQCREKMRILGANFVGLKSACIYFSLLIGMVQKQRKAKLVSHIILWNKATVRASIADQ